MAHEERGSNGYAQRLNSHTFGSMETAVPWTEEPCPFTLPQSFFAEGNSPFSSHDGVARESNEGLDPFACFQEQARVTSYKQCEQKKGAKWNSFFLSLQGSSLDTPFEPTKDGQAREGGSKQAKGSGGSKHWTPQQEEVFFNVMGVRACFARRGGEKRQSFRSVKGIAKTMVSMHFFKNKGMDGLAGDKAAAFTARHGERLEGHKRPSR